MLLNEFVERTHYYPTAEEYRRIEEEYYAFDGDKDAFCKMWKRKGIEGASRRAVNKVVELKTEVDKLRIEVERLREERNAWLNESMAQQQLAEKLRNKISVQTKMIEEIYDIVTAQNN